MKKNLQKILPILSLSLIFFVVCLFVFLFLNREININKKIFEDNEVKWQEEAERRERIRLLNNSIKKIETEKDLFETHFAQSSNIVPFLDMMESLGEKVGAKTEVTLVDIPKEGNILVIEMKVLGSFEKIYKFLLLLENSPYKLEIVSVDISKQNIWEASLKIKLLSFMQ
ncbi:MAG: hypothetical protein AAB493_01005 [Patescibacteria group bacterium]